METYISTACLKETHDLQRVLEIYKENGIVNVEMGCVHSHNPNTETLVQGHGLRYLIHNYFPAPEKSFIINLAAQDLELLARSIAFIKSTIEFCKRLGVPLYTFHSGFRTEFSDDFKEQKGVVPYEVAFKTFVESLKEISAFADEKGIKVAIENNPAKTVKGGLMTGELLMMETKEFERLFKEVPSKNLGMLVDLGHLKVSAHHLGFDKDEFVKSLKDHIFAFHVHHNDGEADTHENIAADSWCVQILKEVQLDVPAVLEVGKLEIAEILAAKEILENI